MNQEEADVCEECRELAVPGERVGYQPASNLKKVWLHIGKCFKTYRTRVRRLIAEGGRA